MNLAILNNVPLNLKEKRSIGYRRAACAIEEAATTRAEKRAAKAEVIKYLEGKSFMGQVRFSDGSTAKY